MKYSDFAASRESGWLELYEHTDIQNIDRYHHWLTPQGTLICIVESIEHNGMICDSYMEVYH